MSAEGDIDRFIQEQKRKIAREREDLHHINGKQIPAPSTNGYHNGDIALKENFPPKAPANQHIKSDDVSLPVGNYMTTKEKLQKERQEEYKKFIKEKNNRSATKKTNTEGDGMSLPIGERLSAQDRARMERNKEYNDFLKQKGGGRRKGQDLGPEVPNTGGQQRPAPGPANGYSNEQSSNSYGQQQPTNGYNIQYRQGNDSYNASRQQRDSTSQTPVPRGYDDLPPRGPRKGWGTPQPLDYDDMLKRKREEELRYRRYDDVDYYQPRLKPAHSDPYLNRYDDNGRRSTRPEYYDDYDRRRVRFSDEVPPAAREGPPYSDRSARPRQRESFEEPIVYDWSRSKGGRSRTFTDGDRPKPALKQEDPERPPRAKSATLAGETGLPFGQRDTGSATRKKKEQYRKELEQQMQEAKAAKQREKAIDRSPGFPGSTKPPAAPNPSGRQSRNQGQPGIQQQQQQQPPPQGYTPSFLQQPYSNRPQPASTTPYPSGGQYDDIQSQAPSYGAGSRPYSQIAQAQPPIGDLGLKEALARSQPERLDRPFSLNYPQPSTLNQPTTNTDPYMYYGMRNPLEADPTPIHGLSHPTTAAGSAMVPPLSNRNSPLMERYLLLQQQQQQLLQQQQQLEQQFPSSGPNQLNQQLNNPAVSKQVAAQFRGESSIKNFVGDSNLSPRSQANAPSYREQLLIQMREKETKKNAEASSRAAYEAKIEKEIEVYDPWGKGGGGAPMRDKQGKIVADLKKLHNRNETILNDPNRKDLQLYAGAGNAPPTNPAAALASGQEVSPLLAAAAASAGGGVGVGAAPGPSYGRIKGSITGAAPDPSADASRNEYQDQLKLQVEEKKRRELEEKEKIRLEEEKEQKRLEAQRERIKKEYEAEIERKKQKEEMQRKQKEDMEKQLEDKRKEAENKKKEVNEKRRREAEEQLRHRDLNHNVSKLTERVTSPPIPALRTKGPELQRISSPPIPTLRKKDAAETNRPPPEPAQRDDDFPSERSSSPPVPAVSTKERGGPKDEKNVMGALSAMRVQLAYEQQRIQSQLDKHRDYDPYNPMPKAAHAPRRGSPQVDVFELARHKGSVAVMRNTTHQAAEDFDGLKNRSGSRTRQQVKENYPNKPISDVTLEAQQRALLRAQQEKLEEMRKGRKATTNDIPSMRDIGRGSPAIPLDSDSAFIGIDSGETHMPKTASRPTRSSAVPSPVNSQPRKTGRSVSRLDHDDLDKIIAKSQARSDAIETLHDRDSDPDDILNKFLSKKSYDSRPPSGKSEDLSLWLKPSLGQT